MCGTPSKAACAGRMIVLYLTSDSPCLPLTCGDVRHRCTCQLAVSCVGREHRCRLGIREKGFGLFDRSFELRALGADERLGQVSSL